MLPVSVYKSRKSRSKCSYRGLVGCSRLAMDPQLVSPYGRWTVGVRRLDGNIKNQAYGRRANYERRGDYNYEIYAIWIRLTQMIEERSSQLTSDRARGTIWRERDVSPVHSVKVILVASQPIIIKVGLRIRREQPLRKHTRNKGVGVWSIAKGAHLSKFMYLSTHYTGDPSQGSLSHVGAPTYRAASISILSRCHGLRTRLTVIVRTRRYLRKSNPRICS